MAIAEEKAGRFLASWLNWDVLVTMKCVVGYMFVFYVCSHMKDVCMPICMCACVHRCKFVYLHVCVFLCLRPWVS